VPPILARQLLFPSRPLPEALSPLGVPDDGAGAALENIDLTARRIASAMHDRLCLVPLRAPKGASHVEVVRSICRAIGREVFEYTGDAGANADESGLSSFATLCWLKKADMFLGYDVVCSLGSDSGAIDFQKLPLPSIPIIIFLGITDRQQLTRIPGTFLQPIVDIPGLSYQERVTHWKRELSERTAGLEDAIAECARRFRYEKNTISAICAGLKKQPGEISRPSVIQACRHELELDLGELAQKVIPRFEHEELILPHKQQVQFEELVRAMESLAEVHYDWGTAKAWNEAGISALFAGPPGTGKTMAAEILAERLHLPLYRIDLSQVVNKYIGETEKNLKRVFDVCDITDVILFFDEADSLFGKRTEVKDAHDRYANLEISYLLDRMERFKGLAILATNRKKDLDEAFLRRLRFIIDFSLPEIRQRYRIWRQVIPSTVDDSELDFDFLAGQFPLVGGHIRSIVFNACLQSAGDSTTGKDSSVRKLTMEQVIIAVKREYDKLNRSISLEHFGPYAAVVKKLES
jgi:hypothetical protein